MTILDRSYCCYYYQHFIDEETEAWRNQVACIEKPSSLSKVTKLVNVTVSPECRQPTYRPTCWPVASQSIKQANCVPVCISHMPMLTHGPLLLNSLELNKQQFLKSKYETLY